MKTQPLTLLPHKTQSKLQTKYSANPGFEGGQGGPGLEGSGLRVNGGRCWALEKRRGVQGGSRASKGVPGQSRAPRHFGLKARKNQKNAPELYG